MPACLQTSGCALREAKVQQIAKIRDIARTLIGAGFLTLNDQAGVLNLSRSTTWTLIQCSHKGSGLSAATINRMLSSPTLPPAVRAKILEYVREKMDGAYGHTQPQLQRFRIQLHRIFSRSGATAGSRPSARTP